MEHEHIEPGDCVTLKSGCGPVMCVTSVENTEDDAIVTAVWFTCDNVKQTDHFPMIVLKCAGHETKTKAKKK
jgi:uncharacterized protein YodC (DUF2158 family)